MNSDVYRNPDSSECEICFQFIIPRYGILIRNCMHNCCERCLRNCLKSVDDVCQLQCPMCKQRLEDRECRKILGHERMDKVNLKPLLQNLFSCQTPNCDGVWDSGDYRGIYKCPICKAYNCISCMVIHEGLSCKKYKSSPAYKKMMKSERIPDDIKSISCYSCLNTIFIREGGCGAFKCNHCNHQVCRYTGLKVGPTGCECTPSKPCHADCTSGCIPDD